MRMEQTIKIGRQKERRIRRGRETEAAQRSGDMPQWVRHLLYKHENQSVGP